MSDSPLPVNCAADQTVGRLSKEQSLLLLDELAGMSRAGIPWSLGLAPLLSTHSRSLTSAAEDLQRNLESGGTGAPQFEQIGATFGKPLASLLEIAQKSGRAGSVLQGLVEVIRAELERRQNFRLVMYYPVVAILLSFAILGSAMWMHEHPESWSWIEPTENDWASLQQIRVGYWQIPMLIGFALPLITVLYSFIDPRWRPTHWSQIAWFSELVALQIRAQQSLSESVQRAAECALSGKEKRVADDWAMDLSKGSLTTRRSSQSLNALATDQKGTMELLSWTLSQNPMTPDSRANSLDRIAALYREKAHRLHGFWEVFLPRLVLISTFLGLVTSYTLHSIIPLYQFVAS